MWGLFFLILYKVYLLALTLTGLSLLQPLSQQAMQHPLEARRPWEHP